MKKELNLDKTKKILYELIKKSGKILKKEFFQKENNIDLKFEFKDDFLIKY